MRLADQELVDRVILSEYPEHAESKSDDASGEVQNGTDGTNGENEGDGAVKDPVGNANEETETPVRTRGILLSRVEQIQAVILANAIPVEVSKIKAIDKTVRGAQDPGKNKKSLL